MEGDAVTSILMLLLGAIVALLGSWARAWIDRESAVSNDLYKQRVEALNAIWKTFLPVRTIYARKLPRGHENWLKEKRGFTAEVFVVVGGEDWTWGSTTS